MTNLPEQLTNLRRPRLLIRAARHGVSSYRRSRDLQRITGQAQSASSRAVVESLLLQEETAEQTRKAHDGTYSAGKHIEILIALMAESRNLPVETRPATRTGWRPKTV
ncbi:MAG: DUF6477 family protein [Litoreibacter sp.]|uniref:DUF6477 family protein n=1 Tax=Litoreibacter sp. TaxID=1969459 RepID=UPI00329959C2